MAQFPIISLHFTRIAGVLLALLVNTPSHANDARPEDVAAVNACLKRVKEKADVPVPGAHGHAAQIGPRKKEDCIGVVTDPCLEKDENSSTMAMVQCSDREFAVWDDRLNAAYKKVMADAEADVAEGFRKVQRAWIVYRDATCAQPYLVHKGTMAQPMGAHCMMTLTAHQTLWLETWLEEQ